MAPFFFQGLVFLKKSRDFRVVRPQTEDYPVHKLYCNKRKAFPELQSELKDNSSEKNMAESQGSSNSKMPKLEFQIKKKQFDLIADHIACNYCKIVPRKSPIYHSSAGSIVCEKCKNNREHLSFHRNNITIAFEKMLFTLPRSCQFMKNGCKIVLDSNDSIVYHEEDCEYRDILCIFAFCKEICSAKQLQNHVKTEHKNLDITLPSTKIQKCGSNFNLKSTEIPKLLKDKTHRSRWDPLTFEYNEKKFFFQAEIGSAKKSIMIWIQLFGSKFEAKNFHYWIQVGDLTVGKTNHEGPVKSIDDNKTEVFESQIGLLIPFALLEKCLQDDKLTVEFGIKDLKPKEENSDQKYSSDDDEDKDKK